MNRQVNWLLREGVYYFGLKELIDGTQFRNHSDFARYLNLSEPTHQELFNVLHVNFEDNSIFVQAGVPYSQSDLEAAFEAEVPQIAGASWSHNDFQIWNAP